MAGKDKNIRVTFSIDQEDINRQLDAISSQINDKLSRSATEAIKNALNQGFKTSGGGTTNFTGGGNSGNNGGGTTGGGGTTNNGGNGGGPGHINHGSGDNGNNGNGNGSNSAIDLTTGRGARTYSGSTVGSYRERVNAGGGGDFTTTANMGNKDFNSAIQDVNRNISTLNSAIRERSRTTTVASRTGRITYNQNERMRSTSESITSGTYAKAKDAYQKQLESLDTNYNKLQDQLNTAKAPGSNASSDSIKSIELQIKQNQELSNAYQKYIDALNNAASSLKEQDASMSGVNNGGGVNVAAKRGSVLAAIQDRSYATGARMVGGAANAVYGMYTSGISINQSTGQQALEMGTLAGGKNDQQVREQVQSYRGRYGYNTQQGLDFYEQAMRQQGPALTADQARSRVGEIENQGRASGLREQTYTNLLSSSAGAGSINSNADMKSIVQTVLAANEMSGNSGNKEQNTQTLTNLISSIGATRNVTTQGIQNAGVMQSSLSSAGRAWQGDAGANNIASMNSSFQSASKGQNNSLLYLVMRQRGEGGVQGYQNAQIQAEKGLTDPDNIKALRQYVSNMSRSGANGRAMAATYINNSGMTTGPKAAKELVDEIDEGQLSDSQIAKKQREAERKGKQADKKGSQAYQNSQLKTQNRRSANDDRNKSKMASDLNPLTEFTNNITSSLPGAIMTSVGTGMVLQGMGNVGGAGFSGFMHSGLFSDTSAGGGFFSRVGKGIGGLFKRGGTTTATETAADMASKGAGVTSDAAKAAGAAGDAAKGAEAVGEGVKVGSGFTRGLEGAGGALRVAGKIATPIALAAGAFSTYEDYKSQHTQAGKNKAVAHGVGSTGGGILGGMAAGAATGAAAGTVFGPLGTLVAGVGGGIVGGIAGSSLGGWIGNKAGDAWNWVTGTKDNKKKTSGSQAKVATSQSLINQKNQQQMLDQWQKIMDKWTKNIKDTNSANGSSGKATAKSSSSKSGHAFGGLVTQRTEIAEGDKPEYVVPLDPAKQNSTKSALSQITQMTGIRSTDERPQMVTQAGPFQPNITINHTGNGGSNDDDILITKLNQALKNATDDYRFNFQKG